MSRAQIYTGLSLDEWARINAINPCAFNQVQNPANAPHDACDAIWLQHGYTGGSERILGREDVAQAIATAEDLIAHRCGFWTYPNYIGESVPFPTPKRGWIVEWPILSAGWGMIIRPGVAAQATIELCAPIVYTDEDGDGVDDTATVTILAATMTAAGASMSEVNLYPPVSYFTDECGEHTKEWRIRPFKICEDAVTHNVTITLNRCQLVLPHLWLHDEPLSQDDDTNFLTCLDVMRDYTDSGTQAQYVWQSVGECCVSGGQACQEVCQSACLLIKDSRIGHVQAVPASYSAGSWSIASVANCGYPNAVRLYYLAGLQSMSNALKEAITRLSNVLLPEAPCGCTQTRQRWERDRELQDINTLDANLAFSAFGTSARGAIFAWSVVKQLNPLGGARSLV